MMIKRAHGRREIVVRVALEVHVLGEVFRLHQFADVVEIGANAAERGVRADRFGGGFGEVRHDQAVMIGARALRSSCGAAADDLDPTLPARKFGRDLEEMLEDRKHAADDRRGEDSVADGERALHSDHFPIVRRSAKKRSIGPMRPKVSDENQIATPTPNPARIKRLRRRTCRVR